MQYHELDPTTIDLTKPAPLVDTDAAATILGQSPRTLAGWRTRRVGPAFVRLSHCHVRYRPCDLLAHIERKLVDHAGTRGGCAV